MPAAGLGPQRRGTAPSSPQTSPSEERSQQPPAVRLAKEGEKHGAGGRAEGRVSVPRRAAPTTGEGRGRAPEESGARGGAAAPQGGTAGTGHSPPAGPGRAAGAGGGTGRCRAQEAESGGDCGRRRGKAAGRCRLSGMGRRRREAGRSLRVSVCLRARRGARALPPPRLRRRAGDAPGGRLRLRGWAVGRAAAEPSGEARGGESTGSAGRPRPPRSSPEPPAGRAAGGVRERRGRAARRVAGSVPASNRAVMPGPRLHGWGSSAWSTGAERRFFPAP